MRKRASVLLATAVALVVAVFGLAPAAQASYTVEMHAVCQLNYSNLGYRATLAYPNQGGFGWRCYLMGGGGGLLNANIEEWCDTVYGLHARGGSTAYNWRCDY